MKKKALITGITGQGGLFLTSQLLKDKEYEIVGTSRKKITREFYKKLDYLGVESDDLNRISVVECNLLVDQEIASLINSLQPSYIYNLIGPGSVSESIKFPQESSTAITHSFDNLVKGLIDNKNFSPFFQPSSSEMFAHSSDKKLDENSDFLPLTPYAESKLYCHNSINLYREKYDWQMSCGILFNHESEFRPDSYLIMKIINSAFRIKNGKSKSLTIGSLGLVRDWGYVGDVALAMKKINEDNSSTDYVVGTGVGRSIEDIIKIVFGYLDLDYEKYISIDENILRKNEPKKIIADPRKIKKELDWESFTEFEEIILRSIKYKLLNQ